MIKKENFSTLLETLGFSKNKNIYTKKFTELQTELKVDFEKKELIYPTQDGLMVHDKTTSNFSSNENFVVFESVHRLLSQGYKPEHIELEPKWQVGHGASGGKADILIKDNSGDALLIIECKTAGAEFTNAWKTTQVKPTQLFSYVQQVRSVKYIALYASDFVDNELTADYYLINVYDNEKLLENSPNLKAYKDANTVDEIYQVWSETYKKEYATLGLFEDNEAYKIGKTKYALKDLKTVSSRDIQSKYHEFATIMRQHNVSGRENAFDKLVNLFLCKVVDETNNSDELKFYWKGVAYDDPFSLQDRLNHLYKVGMKKFLGEDITYIENQQIDDAFSVFKDKPNMTKEIIQGFFKELKFFTNNDFAFVDVHNEELFYQNFEVLLKIVKMLQDIKLTGGEDNQFLGDMFEGFLDQGVKQSEGQFFTPMPIVKFIINALPLETIQQNEDNPKAIDYACGAGHFLTEVANHFEKKHHKNIVGIEKEYRLSKVAKVSSFMYGQDDIQIVYHDALSKTQEVKENDYSILVANPPYSVKGFLETLSQEEREAFELIESIDKKSFTANNAIECFFIERAKQLLKKDGVAGIILPSSILSKGSQNINSTNKNIYVQTRELILKYFDIIAIAEFGSGTFGKTGTNTVTLFLQRKADNPNMAKHLENMVATWFEGDFTLNKLFKDENLLEAYSTHIEVDLKLYKTVLTNTHNEELFKVEMFSEYKQEFEKLSETKNRKKQKSYKALSAEDKSKREQEELLKYIRLIEQDKLYYFSLAYLNKKEVIIVKAPSTGADNKKFLGYEWSGRKGDEGIKYITSSNTIKLDEEAQALEQILNLNSIQTPLYNPKDKYDKSKINSLILKNFSDDIVAIPKELESYVSKARVVDMLDFSRKEFSKAFSLNPKRRVEIIGKAEWQVKLGDIANVIAGQSPKSEFYNENKNGLPFYQGKKDFGEIYLKMPTVWTSKVTKISIRNDLLMSVRAPVGAVNINNLDEICIGRGLAVIRVNEVTTQKYLFEFCNTYDNYFKGNTGAIFDSISSEDLRNSKIPLPPLKIQKEIIEACEVVDDGVEKANEEIERAEEEIEKEINSIQGKEVKLGDLHKTSSGGTPLSSKNEYYYNGSILWVNSGEVKKGLILDSKTKINKLGLDNSSAKLFPKDTVLIAMYGATVGQVGILGIEATTNQAICGLFPNKKILLPLYSYFYLKNQTEKFINLSVGTARTNISQEIIKNFKIPLPPLETQKKIVQKIQKLETKILKAKEIIEGSAKRKEGILEEYLK